MNRTDILFIVSCLLTFRWYLHLAPIELMDLLQMDSNCSLFAMRWPNDLLISSRPDRLHSAITFIPNSISASLQAIAVHAFSRQELEWRVLQYLCTRTDVDVRCRCISVSIRGLEYSRGSSWCQVHQLIICGHILSRGLGLCRMMELWGHRCRHILVFNNTGHIIVIIASFLSMLFPTKITEKSQNSWISL